MAIVTLLGLAGVYGDISLSDVERTITMRSATVQAVTTATVKNEGSTSVSKFQICFSDTEQMQTAFVAVLTADKRDLAVKKLDTDENHIAWYRVSTAKAIEPGASMAVTISAVFGSPYWPHPKKKSFYASQTMRFEQSLHVCSPYKVSSQKTMVKISSKKDGEPVTLMAYDPQPASKTSQMVTYGPFENVAPLSTSERMTMFVSNDNDCAYFTRITRDIEVLHWGTVAVVERFELKHGGAAIDGDFNRVPFMMSGRGGGMAVPAALTDLRAVLPRSARQIDYRDVIGNISTSWVRKDSGGFVNMEMKPRYPIVGGWKAYWELWYYLPLKTVLQIDSEKPNNYVLNVSFAHPYPGMYARQVDTRVTLPEGAHSIGLISPRGGAHNISHSWSWMDYTTEGRPVLEFTVNDILIPEKFQLNHKFQVLYTFNSMHMIREPLYLSLFIFILFFTYLIGTHSRLRILRPGQAKALDEIAHNKKIVEYFIDAFDDLWSHLRSLVDQSEAAAKKPVEHKWKSFLSKSKQHSTKLSDVLEKIAGKHTKDTLKKLVSKIKELVEVEHSRAGLVGGADKSNETEKQIRDFGNKASRLEDEVLTILRSASDDAGKGKKTN